MIDPRGRVWCHILCQALSLAAGLGMVAAVPHIDPNLVSVTAIEAPKLLGGPDREDPPEPEWLTISTASPAASGTGDTSPPPFIQQHQRYDRRWWPGYYAIIANNRIRQFAPPM